MVHISKHAKRSLNEIWELVSHQEVIEAVKRNMPFALGVGYQYDVFVKLLPKSVSVRRLGKRNFGDTIVAVVEVDQDGLVVPTVFLRRRDLYGYRAPRRK